MADRIGDSLEDAQDREGIAIHFADLNYAEAIVEATPSAQYERTFSHLGEATAEEDGVGRKRSVIGSVATDDYVVQSINTY